jgi:chromosome segregation ATPase
MTTPKDSIRDALTILRKVAAWEAYGKPLFERWDRSQSMQGDFHLKLEAAERAIAQHFSEAQRLQSEVQRLTEWNGELQFAGREMQRERDRADALDEEVQRLREALERAEIALNSADIEVEQLRAACGQASFALRELLPNDPDAQLTVRIIDAALSQSGAAAALAKG